MAAGQWPEKVFFLPLGIGYEHQPMYDPHYDIDIDGLADS